VKCAFDMVWSVRLTYIRWNGLWSWKGGPHYHQL